MNREGLAKSAEADFVPVVAAVSTAGLLILSGDLFQETPFASAAQ